MSMPESFLVVVQCMTFNHHAYIEDAMNGFCMQKTDFPYICIVMDDCSTDGEQEVIKNYVAEHFNSITNEETDDYVLNLCQHKTNENCYFAVFYLKYNHYSIKKDKVPYYLSLQNKSKYIAYCEGDDYWIDAMKLQKQMDVLEKYGNITMVYSNYQTVDEKKNNIIRPIFEDYYKKLSKTGDILPTLFKTNFPLTLTTMFRKEIFHTSIYANAPSKLDYMLFLSAAFCGNAFYFNDIMGAYRNSPNGMINTKKELVFNETQTIRKYFTYKYLNGESKKESFWNDIVIKHRIMMFALRLKKNTGDPFFYEIIKLKKSLMLYIIPSIIMLVLKKIKNNILN